MKIGKFSESLKKNDSFKEVYECRNSRADKFLVMYVKKNNLRKNRLGISCSKKIGNSIVRHHLARLIRESYRLSEGMFQNGWDIVVVVRNGAQNIDFFNLNQSLLHLAGLHKILNREKEEFC